MRISSLSVFMLFIFCCYSPPLPPCLFSYYTLNACLSVDSVKGIGPHLNCSYCLFWHSEYPLSKVLFPKDEKLLFSRLNSRRRQSSLAKMNLMPNFTRSHGNHQSPARFWVKKWGTKLRFKSPLARTMSSLKKFNTSNSKECL